jgi:acyltransferase
MEAPARRHVFIDNAKAIAILLVVVGHTDGISPAAKVLIYSFHMPAFFFMSGFLLKDRRLGRGFARHAAHQAQRLVLPYLAFGVISLLYAVANSAVKHGDAAVSEMALGLLYGSSTGLKINVVLWFFPCLYVTSLLYFLLAGSMRLKGATLVLLAACLAYLLCQQPRLPRLPWGAELSGVALAFYAAGKYLSTFPFESAVRARRVAAVAVAALLSTLLFYGARLNGRVDLAFEVFRNPLLFLLNSFTGIAVLLTVSVLLPGTKACRYLSQSAVAVFPLHPLLFSVFTGIGMLVFKLPHSFQESLIYSLLYTCGALLICYPLSAMLFKYAPLAVGGRRA